MFTATFHLALGAIPLLLLALAVAVRPAPAGHSADRTARGPVATRSPGFPDGQNRRRPFA